MSSLQGGNIAPYSPTSSIVEQRILTAKAKMRGIKGREAINDICTTSLLLQIGYPLDAEKEWPLARIKFGKDKPLTWPVKSSECIKSYYPYFLLYRHLLRLIELLLRDQKDVTRLLTLLDYYIEMVLSLYKAGKYREASPFNSLSRILNISTVRRQAAHSSRNGRYVSALKTTARRVFPKLVAIQIEHFGYWSKESILELYKKLLSYSQLENEPEWVVESMEVLNSTFLNSPDPQTGEYYPEHERFIYYVSRELDAFEREQDTFINKCLKKVLHK